MLCKSWIDGKYSRYPTRRVVLTLFARYAQISTFGRLTVRKFNKNVSAMKEFAARDYEQLLIVRICTVCCRDISLIVRSSVRDPLL